MSTIAVSIEKEFEAIEPEDAQLIQRALMEMLQVARRKKAGGSSSVAQTVGGPLASFSLGGFQAGIDPHKLGQVPDEL